MNKTASGSSFPLTKIDLWTDSFLDQARHESDFWADHIVAGDTFAERGSPEGRGRLSFEAQRHLPPRLDQPMDVGILKPPMPGCALDFVKATSKSQRDLLASARELANYRNLAKIGELTNDQEQLLRKFRGWSDRLAGGKEVLAPLKMTSQAMSKALSYLRQQLPQPAAALLQTAVDQLDRCIEILTPLVSGDHDLSQWNGIDSMRTAHNALLDITEDLINNPDLFLVKETHRLRQLGEYPEGAVDYFRPGPAPEWMVRDRDAEEKLRQGGRVWQQHRVGCLLILFGASLPYCYLMKRGIPMLYRTNRLSRPEFIAHRIHETAIMLENVMRPEGFYVIRDQAGNELKNFCQKVQKRWPRLQLRFGWCRIPFWQDDQGKRFQWRDFFNPEKLANELSAYEDHGEREPRAPSTSSPNPAIGQAHPSSQSHMGLYEGEFPEIDPKNPGHYLWGAGYIQAKKVRILHASMRYWLLQEKEEPFDVQANGYPINQEDLAFTLLTFGYVVPIGLEKWGCLLSQEEKEGFYFIWKLVGHTMGIRDELLPDNLHQAQILFEKIKARQAGASERGKQLTGSLCQFVEDFLPSWMPCKKGWSACLIADQLGKESGWILDEAHYTAGRNWLVRIIWWTLRHPGLRTYFFMKHLIFQRTAFMQRTLELAALTLIESWKGAFERKPFYLTEGLGGYKEDPAVAEDRRQRIAAVRQRVFNFVLGGVFSLVLLHFVMFLSILLWLAGQINLAWPLAFPISRWMPWTFGVSLALAWASMLFLRRRLRQESKQLHHLRHPQA